MKNVIWFFITCIIATVGFFCRIIYENSVDWVWCRFWYMVYIYMDYNKAKKT